MVVDETGVGNPVVDMLRRAGLGCEICPVTITSGAREHQVGASWNVPKQDLVAGVQVLLEQGDLKIAKKLKQAGALMKELMDFKMRQSDSGRLRFGADGSGEHDDLAIALALACWRARRRTVGGGEEDAYQGYDSSRSRYSRLLTQAAAGVMILASISGISKTAWLFCARGGRAIAVVVSPVATSSCTACTMPLKDPSTRPNSLLPDPIRVVALLRQGPGVFVQRSPAASSPSPR